MATDVHLHIHNTSTCMWFVSITFVLFTWICYFKIDLDIRRFHLVTLQHKYEPFT